MSWITCNLPWQHDQDPMSSFCGQRLNFPGVLLELEDGERILIGHGTVEIPSRTRVLRYQVLDMPGLEVVTGRHEELLEATATQDFLQMSRNPRFEEFFASEGWVGEHAMKAVTRLGFRGCDDNPNAFHAAETAMHLYFKAFFQAQTDSGSVRPL